MKYDYKKTINIQVKALINFYLIYKKLFFNVSKIINKPQTTNPKNLKKI